MDRIEFAIADGNDDFAAHHVAFEMSVGIILAGAIVSANKLTGWEAEPRAFSILGRRGKRLAEIQKSAKYRS